MDQHGESDLSPFEEVALASDPAEAHRFQEELEDNKERHAPNG
jgi:hypothetical protein